MVDRTRGIGPVPEGVSEELRGFLTQVRRLLSAGVANGSLTAGGAGASSGSGSTIIIGGGSSGGSSDPDYTAPPSPINFTASAGLSYVFTETDAPTFTMGHGYLRTNIYGAKWPYDQIVGPTFGDAELVHQFTGQIGAFPSEPATRWALWAKWETNDGIESVAPSGGAGGVVVETGQDVSLLLEALSGQITESHLYQALGDKIAAFDPDQLDNLAESLVAAVAGLHSESQQRIGAVALEALDRAEAVAIEAQARIDAVTAEATARANALLAEATARGADITQVRTEFQAADTSLASDITTLTAAVGDNAAAIEAEETARVAGDEAEATARELLAATVTSNNSTALATIENVRRTLVDSDESSAEQSMILVSTQHRAGLETTAAILEEASTRTTDLQAEATKRETLSVKVFGVADPSGLTTAGSGLLFDVQRALATADSAQVERIAGLEAKVDIPEGSSIATVLTTYSTIVDRDAAIATEAAELTAAFTAGDSATLTSAQGYVQSYAYSKATIDASESAQSSSLTAAFQAADTALYAAAQAWVQSYAYSKAQADSAIATEVNTVQARLNSGGDVYASIVAAQSTASAKNATFKQGTAPTATRVGDTWIDTGNGNLLKAWDGGAWVASDDTRIGTTASNVTTLQSQVAGATGSNLLSQIQTEATTRASETGHLSALYTVRVSLTEGGRTVVGGFGISGVSGGTAGSTIDFGVRADRFYVGAPSGTTGVGDILPFIVQVSDTTINGVAVPKGVYMDTAFIRNGTITTAKIGDAQIDNAKIANVSASKITAGTIAVGQWIHSSGYVSGTSGWTINGDGGAEFSNVVIRGTVYATAGEFSSTVRLGAATSFAAGNGVWQGIEDSLAKWRVGVAVGKRIQFDGNELAIFGSSNNKLLSVSSDKLVVDTPDLSLDGSGNARFSGDISGATGVFSGSLAAGVIDLETVTGQNFTYDSPGSHSVVTMPYTGTVRFTICGAGGGGGGGGLGRAGLPGNPGTVSTMTITGVPAGASVSVNIGAGGAGAPSTSDNTAPGSGSTGGNTSITINGTTYNAGGGSGGGYAAFNADPGAGSVIYQYHANDYGDYGIAYIAASGSLPAGIPGSSAGQRALTGYATNIVNAQFASNPSALNGFTGYRGAPGSGGAPSAVRRSGVAQILDPVDGENGDAIPTTLGGTGGNGYAFIEIFNPNSVVLRDEFVALADALDAGLTVAHTWTLVYSGSAATIDLLSSYGAGLYTLMNDLGQHIFHWTNPINNTYGLVVTAYKATLKTNPI